MTGSEPVDIPMFDENGELIPENPIEYPDYSESPGGVVIDTYHEAYPPEEIQVDEPI